MYKVHISVDNNHLKQMMYQNEQTVRQLVREERLNEQDPLIYRLNNDYCYPNDVIKSDSRLDCVTNNSLEGHRIYQDTCIFVMMKACYNLVGTKSRLIVEHSIGDGVFCEIFGDVSCDDKLVKSLKKEMKRVIKSDVDIEKQIISLPEAEKIFQKLNRSDIIRNMEYREKRDITIFKCGPYRDYYIRQLAASTGCISDFDGIPYDTGFILRFPEQGKLELTNHFHMPL
ncbi:MAG: hypothetical protein K8S56_10305 [Candidatus Cloacimonetes bacterium]|nr:hypothetical protein [Candidatus Cloacimonadota bacterium]